ncbi:MAG TPA: (Fe-S)-binding protein, partial [Myxococcales bacterium]|nr:(Fe-S)-binding protein [Myxococcales bacterium]
MTDLRRAAELCEFCPKMCRFACPASEVSSREAWTPWGKVSLAVLAGRAPDPSAALAFGACSGCLRCQTYCAHANDVPSILYAARASAVRAGSAPRPWAEVARRMSTAGHAEEVDLLAVHRRTVDAEMTSTASVASTSVERRRSGSNVRAGERRGSEDGVRAGNGGPLSAFRGVAERVTSLVRPGRAAAPRRPILLAGCDALAAGGRLVRETLAVARALGAPLFMAPEEALCCGLKLVEAGHPEMFAAQAARVRTALLGPERHPGPVHLVLLSPGCVRAIRERWPALPDGSRVEHVTTYLSRALAERPDLREKPKLPGAVAYHDPCELARGLSELTAPRALLASAVEEVREPLRCGTDTSCCGASGLLPRTLPAVARAMAEDRRAELDACGAPIVTASPSCAAALASPDVVSVVAR